MSSSLGSSQIEQAGEEMDTPLRIQRRFCKRCSKATLLLATACLALALVQSPNLAEAGLTNRVNKIVTSSLSNQFFLNEFCDLKSKTFQNPRSRKENNTNTITLNSNNKHSSTRLIVQKQPASSISFGFGSSASAAAAQDQVAPIFKQLNCSIIIVAPKSHGLLVTVNSIGLPKNLTKLGITLNHGTTHAQDVHLEGETTTANYLLTEPGNSKIAINLQSFKPIDWSHISFDILFTVYKKKANSEGGCPNKKWFDCGDNICVPASLVCDKNRNCPNGNDEMVFYRCYTPLFWSIAASTALALMLIIIMVSAIVLVRKRRVRGMSKLNSFSNNQLAADGNDLIQDSKLDLTQESAARSGSYLASNLYLGGFENPVWTATGTLTKQHQKEQQEKPLHQQQSTSGTQQIR